MAKDIAADAGVAAQAPAAHAALNKDEPLICEAGIPAILDNPVGPLLWMHPIPSEENAVVHLRGSGAGGGIDKAVPARLTPRLSQAKDSGVNACRHWAIVVDKCRQLRLIWRLACAKGEEVAGAWHHLLGIKAAGVARDGGVCIRVVREVKAACVMCQ